MRQLRFLVPAATLLAVLAGSPADAGWGHHRHGGSYGSSGASYGGASYGGSSGYAAYSGGSYGSSGGSYGSYGSGGSSGGPGLLARLHARIHSHIAAKRARHASHGSSGYSSYGSSGYSSYGSSGYSSYKSHGSSGYSSYGGSSGHAVHYSAPSASSGSTYSYAAPAVGYGVQQSYESAPQGYDSGVIMDQPYGEGRVIEGGSVPQGEGSAPQGQQGEAPAAEGEGAAPAEASIRADSALITLAVPASARVTVNGRPTTSEGPIRQFMSRGLKPGFSYSYLIEVEAMVDGQLTKNTKTLRVRAGDKERVVFDAPQASDVETALTIRVPADAKVTLAGNLTSAEGETRVFRTQQLTRGQVWDDYEVVVTVVRDGRELTKKQMLQLVAGSERELAFSFDNEADADSLAVR